jgi:hypothetical protein
MILFLIGTPGIGKTTVANEIMKIVPATSHIEVDRVRDAVASSSGRHRLDTTVADAAWWRIARELNDENKGRSTIPPLVIVDSTGASSRFKTLRGVFSNGVTVKLYAYNAWQRCQRKWGREIGLDRFTFLQDAIDAVVADREFEITGFNAREVAGELARSLGAVQFLAGAEMVRQPQRLPGGQVREDQVRDDRRGLDHGLQDLRTDGTGTDAVSVPRGGNAP